MDWSRFASPVEAALRATRAPVLAAWKRPADDERFKSDGTAVMDLDLALERDLADALMPLDDAFGIHGEESGTMREGAPTWHVDPVDGTANFARRLPVFGSQLVLMDGSAPLFAAVYYPLTDDFLWAASGAGAWREGARLRMPDRVPRESIIHMDIARRGLFVDQPTLIRDIRLGSYRTRALGSVAVHLGDVASGAANGYIGGRKSPSPLHDLGPGVLLVREAGGRVSDGTGGDPLADRRRLVAGSPQVHDWLCSLIA